MSFKDELVGFCTLAIMGLLGMALYSGTYSLIYASVGISEPPVAILEMWMSSTHLFCAVGCCVLQGLYAGLFKQRQALPHLAEAQTALFLGMACAITILGNSCLQSGDSCATYYGAASFPRLAAAGSIAWGWVMYVSALGCQAWERGISLGFNGAEGLTASAVMLTLPGTVRSKLRDVCGDAWPSGDGVVPLLFVCGGLVTYHLSGLFPGGKRLLQGARVLGVGLFLGAFIFMPADLWLSTGYNFTALALALNALLGELWPTAAIAAHRSASSQQSQPHSTHHFSLSGLTHKLKSKFASKHPHNKA
jgi:hypothetical protein